MLNGLDLFSGIGGIGIALDDWVRTVAYCEQDRYAQGVLLSRMQSGDIDRAPIWDDVRTLRKEHLPRIDIIYGGFPCQDISVAGEGVGLMAGERSGLYFEIERLIKETNPRFVFLENVPAIRTRGLSEVTKSLTELGYDCRWTVVSAAEVGAPHLRKRWFLLAHAGGERLKAGKITNVGSPKVEKERSGSESTLAPECLRSNVAHANGKGLERQRQKSGGEESKLNNTCDHSWWAIEPNVGRVAHGAPHRIHRIKCLGNSVVPMQAKEAFKKLLGIGEQNGI